MNNNIIVEMLSEFGEVLSIKNEVWGESYTYKNNPNAPQKPILSYLTIDG
jgi:hypothetical protein